MPLVFKQRGNFSVEFAVVGVALSLIFVFSADVIIKLAIKGKLDRLSYSLVNVLKERTQLYDEDYVLEKQEADSMFVIAKNSMARMQSSYKSENFGVVVEELTFREINQPNSPTRYNLGSYTCSLPKTIDQYKDLSVVTTWTRQATLYRITLCYKTSNLFGSLVDQKFTDVNSSSIIIGR
ncbi:tight adherence pilus pseudopilin TadF [Aliivibrio sp. EL58]|uniref:tight adherence pilus pseudopilin TadF n=1 Tax=Aliivibrio sp. EL58 TaxID=2107582 RepID=UPI000EFCC7BA|nr:tight adherence pilus pseudopilin TadF [Aliivibrio sp. EL58]